MSKISSPQKIQKTNLSCSIECYGFEPHLPNPPSLSIFPVQLGPCFDQKHIWVFFLHLDFPTNMAVSAFKSTSKRGTFAATPTASSSNAKEPKTEDPKKKKPQQRRSRSVSAASRNRTEVSSPRLPLNISEFSDTRDNPLFSSSSPSPPDSRKTQRSTRLGESDCGLHQKPIKIDALDTRRGRAASRSSSGCGGDGKFSGRSLSRRRSFSSGRFGDSESEIEGGSVLDSKLRSKNVGNSKGSMNKKPDLVMKFSNISNQTRNLRTWSSQHPPSTHLDSPITPNWEDGSSVSFSEIEEDTIQDFFERTGATDGKNTAFINLDNVTDANPELVNPDAVELIFDIRREYATKFEESQERARKLRADLAVEEQREQELSKILKQILPDSKNSASRKSRVKRKMSNERRRISRCLTEEAMNYFDECVSISTFGSSDFSAAEDPPFCSAAGSTPVADRQVFLSGCSSSSTSHLRSGLIDLNKDLDNQSQCSLSHESYDASVTSTSSNTIKETNHMNGKWSPEKLMNSDKLENDKEILNSDKLEEDEINLFSCAREPMRSRELHDIKSYIKKFEKEQPKEEIVDYPSIMSSYNADYYNSCMSAESVLYEKVILRNRIDFGGLLICDVRIQ
ncbi:hypothetical protein QJS04_geneDACA015100 [Acorus gramineus]|uniref:Uncharacterized protein n=1 Tax=Acorus gramineus TaxID=55184 RepID=A0AAV9BS09_ACOGR|nr:hypothetical protein QJS04_geneDACA015100 [Acorus gramineus]